MVKHIDKWALENGSVSYDRDRDWKQDQKKLKEQVDSLDGKIKGSGNEMVQGALQTSFKTLQYFVVHDKAKKAVASIMPIAEAFIFAANSMVKSLGTTQHENEMIKAKKDLSNHFNARYDTVEEAPESQSLFSRLMGRHASRPASGPATSIGLNGGP